MRISDWSSDVCSSDLHLYIVAAVHGARRRPQDRHIGEMKNDMRLDQRDRWAEQVGVTLRLAGVYGQSVERGADCRTIARRGAERRRRFFRQHRWPVAAEAQDWKSTR